MWDLCCELQRRELLFRTGMIFKSERYPGVVPRRYAMLNLLKFRKGYRNLEDFRSSVFVWKEGRCET